MTRHVVMVYQVHDDQTRYWVGRCVCTEEPVHHRDRREVEKAMAACRRKAKLPPERSEKSE